MTKLFGLCDILGHQKMTKKHQIYLETRLCFTHMLRLALLLLLPILGSKVEHESGHYIRCTFPTC